MINLKFLCKITGSLLFIEMSMLAICLLLSLCFGETDYVAFSLSVALAGGLGLLFKYLGKNADEQMSRHDGYLIVSCTWILFSLVGMLPFLLSGYIPSVTDAFFETMSGFTSTGATLLNTIDTMPHALLFWRSLTQWIGGLGIVFFTLAILPTIGLGDIKLFASEAVGMQTSKLYPRVRTTAKWLWSIYASLTLACTVALYLSGMNLFDSVNHALTTTASGGFSTHQDGIMFFHSPTIEYTTSVFMFLSGISFTLLYLLFIKGKFQTLWQDAELRFYGSVVAIFSLVVAITLIMFSGYDVEHGIRAALFNVISLQTTSSFVSEDILTWFKPLWLLLYLAMFFGACSGSTTGGIKSIRVLMLCKISLSEFRSILHPNAVLPVRINHNTVVSAQVRTLLSFFFLYCLLLLLGSFLITATGIPLFDSFGYCLSSFSNAGTLFAPDVNPMASWSNLPEVAKWVCSFLMLVGRLEIFPVLLFFVPEFWKNN